MHRYVAKDPCHSLHRGFHYSATLIMSAESSSNPAETRWSGDAAEIKDLEDNLRWSLAMETPRKAPECTITLIDAGRNPAKVIWTVRDQAGISLAAAKQLVQSAPVKIPLPFEKKFSEDIVYTVRDAQHALSSEGAVVDIPPIEEWTVVPFEQDFMSLFPRLELDPDVQMIAQIFAGLREGFHRIWMLPSDAPPWESQDQLLEGLLPVGNCGIEDALRGDRSLLSFMEASVLIRVFDMLGTGWNQDEWASHVIVGNPTDENWLWIQEEVLFDDDLQPSVEVTKEGGVTVTFFSVTRLNQVQLVRHRDHYPPGSYHPKSEMLTCATGGLGYVH